MQLFYNGTDITSRAGLTACICREGFGSSGDLLETRRPIYGTGTAGRRRETTEMEAVQGTYRTGKMYLNTMQKDGERMRLIATSMKSGAARRASAVYEQTSLADLLALNAAECGMKSAVYGMDGGVVYPHIRRLAQSAPAFMARLLSYEGAAFKTVGGRFAAIGMESIQQKAAARTLRLTAGDRNVTHTKRLNVKKSSLTIRTPYCTCTAMDEAAAEGADETLSLPAMDAATGGRWARGMLLYLNRQAESLEVRTAFDACVLRDGPVSTWRAIRTMGRCVDCGCGDARPDAGEELRDASQMRDHHSISFDRRRPWKQSAKRGRPSSAVRSRKSLKAATASAPLRAVMSQRRFPRFSARLTTWARTFIFSILTTEKARFWRRLTDGKGGRNHGGRAADA